MKYEIYRGNTLLVEVELQGRLVLNALGENLVNTTFTLPESIGFIKGDSLAIDKHGVFYLESFTVNKNSTNNYDYSAIFQSENFKTTETILRLEDPVNNFVQTSFSIDANAETLIDLCVKNMNRVSPNYTWYKGNVVPTDIAHFDIEEETVYSFLCRLASHYETSFNIFGRIIYFGVFENEIANMLEYGRFKGLTKITKRTNEDSKIVNVLYATGSDENIPSTYPFPRLSIFPPIVNQSSIDMYGRVEGFFRDDSIKPEGSFKVTGVLTPTDFITNISFDVNNHVLNENTQPVINFTSGVLAGYSFKFGYEHSSRTVLVVGSNKTNGVFVPNPELTASIGDTFNITDIRQPQEYVVDAQNRLRAAANKYLANLNLNNKKYEISLDPLYTVPGEDIKINSSIRIKDANLGLDGKFIVNGFDMDLQSFNVKYLRIGNKARTFNSKLSAGIGGNNIPIFVDRAVAISDRLNLTNIEVANIDLRTNFAEVSTEGHSIISHLDLIGVGSISAGAVDKIPVIGDSPVFSLDSAGRMISANPFIYSINSSTKDYILIHEGSITKYGEKGNVISQF